MQNTKQVLEDMLKRTKEKIKSRETLNNVIEAIIHKSGLSKIPKSGAFFQRAFYELSQKEPELFKGFIFDTSGITPFSDELDTILFRLEMSTLLSANNPSCLEYIVNPNEYMFIESYKKLSGNKVNKINNIAQQFTKLVKREGEVNV